MTDTDPATEALYHRLLMERSEAERFRMGLEMCAAARRMVLASLPKDLSPTGRKSALLRRYYSSDFSEAELRQIEAALADPSG